LLDCCRIAARHTPGRSRFRDAAGRFVGALDNAIGVSPSEDQQIVAELNDAYLNLGNDSRRIGVLAKRYGVKTDG